MKKNFKIILGFFGILILVFFSGPKVVEPNLNQEVPSVPENLSELNDWITARELKIEGIKDGNASRIEFYDSIPQKTKYSVFKVKSKVLLTSRTKFSKILLRFPFSMLANF